MDRNIKQKLSHWLSPWADSSKRPILAMLFFVHIVTLWIAGPEHVNKDNFSGLTIVMILFAGMDVYKEFLFKKRIWIYYIIQGVIVFDIAVLMQSGYETAYIALLPVLIFESFGDFEDKRYVALVAFLYYGIFSGLIIIIDGTQVLKTYLPALGLVTFAVWTFNAMYLNQVHLRMKSKKMARELESANMRIENMIIEKERERVARDLHDTLSQGLSALVLQMEAMKAYLDMGKTEKLNTALDQATEHARKTLAESRRVLSDLREEGQDIRDLRSDLQIEINRFSEIFEGTIEIVMEQPIMISTHCIRQMKYICREALNNVNKHSRAKNVSILLHMNEDHVLFRVNDDGIGFNTRIGLEKDGHFGLQGMQERVRELGGELSVYSRKKKGTSIDIRVPLEERLEVI